MPGTGTIWTRHGPASAVRHGEAAVTHEVLARIRAWLRIALTVDLTMHRLSFKK